MKRSLILLVLLLSACAGKPDTMPQKWDGYDVKVEVQPSPPKPGMNEVMVQVSGKHGKGVHGLIVSLRMTDSEAWKQTFPDGDLGVYHGATSFAPDRHDLQVQIVRDGKTSVLVFPVRMGASAS